MLKERRKIWLNILCTLASRLVLDNTEPKKVPSTSPQSCFKNLCTRGEKDRRRPWIFAIMWMVWSQSSMPSSSAVSETHTDTCRSLQVSPPQKALTPADGGPPPPSPWQIHYSDEYQRLVFIHSQMASNGKCVLLAPEAPVFLEF